MAETKHGFVVDDAGNAQFRTVETFFVATLGEDLAGVRLVFAPTEDGAPQDVQFVLPKEGADKLVETLQAAMDRPVTQ